MTDDEIILSLECCANHDNADACDDCPCLKGECISTTPYVLDLINRQKASIENLQKSMLQMAKANIELINKERTEAVREVVEELKSKSFKFMFFKSPCYELRISEVDLDNLVKERVGVDPAEVGVDYLLENGVAISKPKSIRPPADLKSKCGSCIYAKPTTWGNSKVYVECTNAEHIKIYCRRGESARKRLRTAKACKCYVERVDEDNAKR